MANKRFYQFLYTKQPKLSMITGAFQIGQGGSVASGSVTGAGVYSVTKASTGTYKIKLQDNYYAALSGQFQSYAPPGAAEVNVSLLTGSSAYQVAVVGNTDWTSLGVDSDYTVAVGMPFVATATAGSGTGTAKLFGPSNIDSFEILPAESATLQNANPTLGKGSSILFKTMNTTAATTTVDTATFTTTLTMAATNAVASTTVAFKLWYRDSSVLP